MFSCKEDNRRRSGLRQDYLMPQMDIYTSQIDALFIDSSLAFVSITNYLYMPIHKKSICHETYAFLFIKIVILTNDSIFLSVQHVLPAYAIWAVQKLKNFNGR